MDKTWIIAFALAPLPPATARIFRVCFVLLQRDTIAQ